MTHSSAKEIPTSFSPDGKSVLFTTVTLGDAKQSVQVGQSWKPLLGINAGRQVVIDLAVDATDRLR